MGDRGATGTDGTVSDISSRPGDWRRFRMPRLTSCHTTARALIDICPKRLRPQTAAHCRSLPGSPLLPIPPLTTRQDSATPDRPSLGRRLRDACPGDLTYLAISCSLAGTATQWNMIIRSFSKPSYTLRAVEE